MHRYKPLYRIVCASLFLFSQFTWSYEVGVCTHMGMDNFNWPEVKSAMDDLGVTSYRDEVYWRTLERSNGDMTPDAATQGMKDAFAAYPSYESMLIASYGHDRYDEGGQIYSEEGRDAYARYASTLLTEFGSSIKHFEIWNEWNLGLGNPDRTPGTPESYAALVERTLDEIDALRDGIEIIIGATGDDLDDWSWTKGLFETGVHRRADAYSVHLYNYMAGSKAKPEEMFERLERLQEILRTYNDGNDYPVYVTEMGWPTHIGPGGVSEELSGGYTSRFLIEASSYSWIEGVWVYDLFNDGPDPTEREHNFGLYRPDGSAKAGTCYIRNAINLVNDYDFIAKGDLDDGLRYLQLQNESYNQTAFVVFNSEIGNSTSIRTHPNISSLCDAMKTPPAAPAGVRVTRAVEPSDSISVPGLSSTDREWVDVLIDELPQIVMVNGLSLSIEDVITLP